MLLQIIWGSIFLGITACIHMVIIVFWVRILFARRRKNNGLVTTWGSIFIIGGTFAILLASHSIQVWIWAVAIWWVQALPTLEASVYYALSSYTTVGYGDLVVLEPYRIFGSMASVAGMLGFGVSTAILVAVFSRVVLTLHGEDLS